MDAIEAVIYGQTAVFLFLETWLKWYTGVVVRVVAYNPWFSFPPFVLGPCQPILTHLLEWSMREGYPTRNEADEISDQFGDSIMLCLAVMVAMLSVHAACNILNCACAKLMSTQSNTRR